MRVSIVIPIYSMDNATEFLKRNLDSILKQTFKDYEIVISDDSPDDKLETFLKDYPVKYFKNQGKHSNSGNRNSVINGASGELIKCLDQDDYFFDEYSLEKIVHYFTESTWWVVTACTHTTDGKTFFNNHFPYYSESDNTIGAPSVLTFRREIMERFDEDLYWVLDLDLYKRLFRKYGKPKILNQVNVVIGLHQDQASYKLTEQRKLFEHQLLKQKYG